MIYEIFLSAGQEDGFIVRGAKSMDEAVTRTIHHARQKHPGLFDANGMVKEYGFPLVYEIQQWQ